MSGSWERRELARSSTSRSLVLFVTRCGDIRNAKSRASISSNIRFGILFCCEALAGPPPGVVGGDRGDNAPRTMGDFCPVMAEEGWAAAWPADILVDAAGCAFLRQFPTILFK